MPHRSALGFALSLVIFAVLLSPAPRAVAQDKVWHIGWLDPSAPPTAATPSRDFEAFRQALGGLGYTEGRNYIIDARFADTDWTRLPGLAKELVDRGVDVIVTVGTPTVHAAKEATATIPIVMAGSSDPVERGLVSSLAHPGGNVTGVTSNPGPALGGKALQLLKEAASSISRLAILWDTGGGYFLDVQQGVAGELKLTLLPHDVKGVTSDSDFDMILSSVIQEHADSLFAFANFVNLKYEKKIIDFVSNNRLPSMFQAPRYVNAGGLMSYNTSWLELRRRAAVYVDKIFKGAKPADLPVEQPSRFDLVVNLKTAEALGLTIPQSVLVLADKVIE